MKMTQWGRKQSSSVVKHGHSHGLGHSHGQPTIKHRFDANFDSRYF